MSFYDDASLIFLAGAAAGKDGKAHNVKPVPEYGPELITNGDFATDSDWNKEASWSISGGTANYSGVSNAIITQTNLLPQSTSATLKVQWTQTITSGTRLRFFARNYNDSSSSGITVVSVETTGDATYQSGNCNFSGTFTAIVTTTDGFSFKMLGEAGNVGSIDNVSVREVLSPAADFTFSRGSNLSATRVGPTGLIEKGRENLLLQSNQFDTGWNKQSVSVTSGQSGYDGSSDAWILESSIIGGYIRQNISASGVHTFSVYAKADSTDGIALRIVGITDNPYIYFDLTNGNLLFQDASTDIINVNDSESLGGGWYRFSVSYKGSLTQVRIYPSNTSTQQVIGSIYIQDAQLEIGIAATEVISTGATTGKAGLLENEPRFDYSGGATCPSLLLEPSRTNLIGYSEYFAGQVVQNLTLTTNDSTSPEGLTNATLLEPVGTTAKYIDENITGTGTYTQSYFFKKGATSGYPALNLYGNASTDYETGVFDFDSKTFYERSGSATSFTNVSYDYEDYGNGWFRIWQTFTASKASQKARLVMFNSPTPTPGSIGQQSWTANGESFIVWGWQAEAGSYPTSYIPNHSGGTITRGDDDASNTGTIDADNDFTFYFESTLMAEYFTDKYFNSTNFGYLSGYNISGNNLRHRFGGTNYGFTAPEGVFKYLIRKDSTNMKIYLNGTLERTITTLPTGTGDLNLLGGKVHKTLYFPEALSNADCTILTGTSYDTFAAMAEALNYTVYE